MNDLVRGLLVLILLFGLYRELHVLKFYLARRRAHRERFRGLRLVIRHRF